MSNNQTHAVSVNDEHPHVFFFRYNFRSGLYYARKYVERNSERGYTIYYKNTSSFGPTWKKI